MFFVVFFLVENQALTPPYKEAADPPNQIAATDKQVIPHEGKMTINKTQRSKEEVIDRSTPVNNPH